MIDDKNDEFELAWAEDGKAVNDDQAETTTEEAGSAVEVVAAPPVEVITSESIATWRGRVSASDRRNSELEARIKELEADKVKPQVVDVVDETDEEMEHLYTEYPDFKNPLKKREAAIKVDILSEVRKEVDGMLSERVAPLLKDRETLAEGRRVAALSSVYENWEDVVASTAFDEYINGQDGFIATAMNRVRRKGTTEEAVALLKRFKTDTSKPIVNQQRNSQARDAEVVKSRPGSPIMRASADDYDSSFDEAPD